MKKPLKGLLCIAALAASGFFLCESIRDVQTTISLKQTIQVNEARAEEAEAQKTELEETRQKLTNPDYVEYIARGKYLVSREGEQIFKFPSIDKNSTE